MSKITAYELASSLDNKDVFLIDGAEGTRIIEADVLAPLLMQLGIGGEAYTKAQVDNLFANRYTKSEVDNLLSQKYSKAEVDEILANRYTKAEVDNLFANRYTKTEVDNLITGATNQIPNSYTKVESDTKFAYKTTVSSQGTTISNLSTTASNVSSAASNAKTAANNAATAASNAQTAANNAKNHMESQILTGTFVPANGSVYAVVYIPSSQAYGTFRLSVDIYYSGTFMMSIIGEVIISAYKCYFKPCAYSTNGYFLTWYGGRNIQNLPCVAFKSTVANGNFQVRVATDKVTLASGTEIGLCLPNAGYANGIENSSYHNSECTMPAAVGFDPAVTIT